MNKEFFGVQLFPSMTGILQALRLGFVQYFSTEFRFISGFIDISPRVTATLGFIINSHPCGGVMIPPSRSDGLILAVNLD